MMHVSVEATLDAKPKFAPLTVTDNERLRQAMEKGTRLIYAGDTSELPLPRSPYPSICVDTAKQYDTDALDQRWCMYQTCTTWDIKGGFPVAP